MYYGSYLQLDSLLTTQVPESKKNGDMVHDEMLFIIVHQTYELWFKQILHELESVLSMMREPCLEDEVIHLVVARLQRITKIMHLLLSQIDVLETMTPMDFLEFRDALVPASGFQSFQFRLLEIKLGLQRDNSHFTQRLKHTDKQKVEEALQQPSLFDLVDAWLARTPFLQKGKFDFWHSYHKAVKSMLEREKKIIENNATLIASQREEQLAALSKTADYCQALWDEQTYQTFLHEGKRRLSYRATSSALFISLYRHLSVFHQPYAIISSLMDIDELLSQWRYRHTLMVERMLGTKIGTGGSAGAAYLKNSMKYKIFTDLTELSTFLIPRSDFPELPPGFLQ